MQPTSIETVKTLVAEALQVPESLVAAIFETKTDPTGFLFFVKPKDGEMAPEYAKAMDELIEQLEGNYNKEHGYVIPKAGGVPKKTSNKPSLVPKLPPQPKTPAKFKVGDQVFHIKLGKSRVEWVNDGMPGNSDAGWIYRIRNDKNAVCNVPESELTVADATIPEEPESEYSLAESRAGLGELSPVLKDAHGNIIDGFHRIGENAMWHTIKVPHIQTPQQLELARLAVNFARRRVSAAELEQRLEFLIKTGIKPDEIAKKTGISRRTLYRHTPQELKDPEKVDQAKKAAQAKKSVPRGTDLKEPEQESPCEDVKPTPPPAPQTGETVTIKAILPQGFSVDATDKIMTATREHYLDLCDVSVVVWKDIAGIYWTFKREDYDHIMNMLHQREGREPTITLMGEDLKSSWADKTGLSLATFSDVELVFSDATKPQAVPNEKTYLNNLEECVSCKLMFDSSQLKNGLCPECSQDTEKQVAATEQKPELTDEELQDEQNQQGKFIEEQSKKDTAEKKPVRPVNMHEEGRCCPCCGSLVSEDKYELMKKRAQTNGCAFLKEAKG